ncbi:MAG: type III PLP-dependent enzyme [Solirubrobacterales bacterium]
MNITMEEARRLRDQYGTPLLVVSRSRIMEKFQILKDYLPRIGMYYAVKANPNKEILKIIDSCNSYYDVCSDWEIETVMELGVPGERMIHTHPMKKPENIQFAIERGIKWFVFDNEWELSKFLPYKDKINLLMRLSFPNPDCMVNLSYKFGVDPVSALPLALRAREMGLKVKGLCFHVGSQSPNPYKHVEAIIECRRLFNLMTLEGFQLEVVDIGGGFPVEYTDGIMPFKSFFEPIQEACSRYFGSVRVIAEPGRFVVGDGVDLILSVVGKSRRSDIWWYYLDDGVYGSFSGKVFDHCDYRMRSEKEGPREQCIVAGPTCDSFDIIYHNSTLPSLEIGDMLLVPSMGAYTSCSSTSFNGILPARTVVVD